MKCGLYHSPLPEMKLALTSEQALAEKFLRTLQRSALVKFVCVYDEQVTYEIGVIEKVTGLRTHPEKSDVTKPRLPRKKSRRIITKLSEMSADEIWFLRRGQRLFHDGIMTETDVIAEGATSGVTS